MWSSVYLLALVGSKLVQSAPTPTITDKNIEKRNLISGILGEISSLVAESTATGSNVLDNILSDLKLVTATIAPTAVPQGFSLLESAITASPTPSNIAVLGANLVAAGLTTDNVVDALAFVDGLLTGENSDTNDNLKSPSITIYPKAASSDAPYTLTEAELRAAIYIPSTFKYGVSGAPQPVILVPGTGNTGYITFEGNMIKLLTGSTFADPVWLNIPGYMLNDAQVNSEYIAYATNYIYAISQKREVALVTWSQGGLDAQWVTKYWPSTRARITDIVAFSPDYHGTVLANFLATPGEPLAPSVLQQDYESKYVTALRADDGSSAYVTTTTIYSGLYDEVVEPQQGTAASAYLLDVRDVGVTNNEVQSICPGEPAGSFYSHEGTLYNPIGYALLKDALTHTGPGEVSRIDKSLCGDYLAPGLDLADFLLTENAVLIALLAILTYADGVTTEPALMSYAE